MHVHLRINDESSKPEFEPVHAQSLGGRRYKIEFTPGLAYGIAAGDEIELADDGRFEVIVRAGYVAVRVLCPHSLRSVEPSLTSLVASSLGGRLDGNIGRALAYTIPIQSGFPGIEAVFNEFVSATADALWEYGNVYAKDGSPLGWWHSAA